MFGVSLRGDQPFLVFFGHVCVHICVCVCFPNSAGYGVFASPGRKGSGYVENDICLRLLGIVMAFLGLSGL